MKFLLFFTFISILQAAAENTYSQNARLSIELSDTPIKQVLNEIEENSEYYFLYNNKLIDVEKKVSISAKNEKIETILNSIFKGKNVSFLVKDRHVVLSPIDKNGVSENDTITGEIKNSSNEAVIGATVMVKGMNKAVVTDFKGKYVIVAANNSSLVFSFIGMKKQEVAVNGQRVINVTLEDDVLEIDEVITIGYGIVKKSDLTGSVSSIGAKSLADRQATSIGALIQGKAAGVDVSQDKIRIRGVNTFWNTDPLVVIDGFIGGNLSTVNANDIENIEVLKDASSTAIYGARGANGVILINTKSGKVGKLKVNVNAFYGMAQRPKTLGVLNSEQYMDYMTDLVGQANLTPKLAANAPGSGEGVRKSVTFWQDEVFKVAQNKEINVDFSGGTENATFFLGLGYKTNEEITINAHYKDAYVRSRNDFVISKWLKMGTNLALNYKVAEGNTIWDQTSMFRMPPYMPVRDTANYWGYSNTDRSLDMADVYNPIPFAVFSESTSNALEYNGNGWLSLEPLKGLIFRSQMGLSGRFGRSYSWQDQFENSVNLYKNHMYESSDYNFIPQIENTLTYTNKLGVHDFTIMAGNSWQNYARGGSIGIFAEEFANTEIKKYSFGATNRIGNQSSWDYAYLSYFGRLNYQLMDKYLLTVNMRNDKSPRFSKNYRNGLFPSVSLAWKMQNESFIENLGVFNVLKLRVNYGITGNDQIGDFRYVSKIHASGIYYPLGGVALTGATVRENSSFDIHWEEVESRGVGLDMAFLGHSLNVTTDYFSKNSKGILFTVPRPASMGYGASYGGDAIVNAAGCSNKGFEFQVDYKNNIGDLRYSVGANYTNVSNEVTSLGLGQPYLAGVSRTEVGYPIGYFYGFVADGLFKSKAEVAEYNKMATDKGFKFYQERKTSAGDIKFKDLNGDGVVDWEHDRTKIGNSIPKHMYGFNLSLEYKGFDLNGYFSGIAGSNIFMGNPGLFSGTIMQNQLSEVLNRWRSEAEPGNGKQPRAVLGDPNANFRPSTFLVSSGNYFKLRQLSIGYTVPESVVAKAGINRLRFYTSVNNITLTKYAGFDPEVGGDNLNRGIDGYGFPNPVSIIFGIQVGL